VLHRCAPERSGEELHPAQQCCATRCCDRAPVGGLEDRECAEVLLVNGAIRGDVEDVRKALNRGASPNTVAELSLNFGGMSGMKRQSHCRPNVTALMHAVSNDCTSVVNLLLDSLASPTACDSRGWNVLCHALAAGEVDNMRQVLMRITPGNLAKQKVAVHNHLRDVLEACRTFAGEKAAAAVLRETQAPGGVLALDSVLTSLLGCRAPGSSPRAPSADAGRGRDILEECRHGRTQRRDDEKNVMELDRFALEATSAVQKQHERSDDLFVRRRLDRVT